MARIAGVDLPRDKRIEYGLTYIYGIGLATSREILAKAGVDPDIRVRDLTEEDAGKIRKVIDADYMVEVTSEERFRSTSRDSWRSDLTEVSDTEEDSL